jgi:hypothetical protein
MEGKNHQVKSGFAVEAFRNEMVCSNFNVVPFRGKHLHARFATDVIQIHKKDSFPRISEVCSSPAHTKP